jgi:hypothetical protein
MSRRITQGDAQAVLNAFGTGGRVILRNGQTAEAAPADFFGTHGSIRPFRNSPWDRGHFCAEDWHVILIAQFEGGDASFTRQQAEATLNPVTNSFTLDDAPLPTTRTSISRFLDPQPFGFEEAYYFQEGKSCLRMTSAWGNTGCPLQAPITPPAAESFAAASPSLLTRLGRAPA